MVIYYLRRQLRFRNVAVDLVCEILRNNTPTNWTDPFFRISVHARQGNFTNKEQIVFGMTTADYLNALRHLFAKQTSGSNIQVGITSDNVTWTRNVLRGVVNESIQLLYSVNHNVDFDLALPSFCDAVITSTGTFGWWGAWLIDKQTIYFEGYPRPRSEFGSWLTPGDYTLVVNHLQSTIMYHHV